MTQTWQASGMMKPATMPWRLPLPACSLISNLCSGRWYDLYALSGLSVSCCCCCCCWPYGTEDGV